MKSIQETTNELFGVDYEKDFEDEKTYDKYVDIAKELIKKNGWQDVYACWYDYLITNCKTEDAILNFANLFWCYEGYEQAIPNAVEFCAFFYANISLKRHPEAVSVLDGIAWNALIHSGIYSENDYYFEDFSPMSNPEIVAAIEKWQIRKKGAI